MGDDWVVDSLLGFLQSSVWRCPVDKFIEQNCTVFDTEEENKFSYTEIYNKYREMVDGLLESFTGDLGITPKQLAEACSQSSTLGESHQSLFEQILATEDFLLFKSIMVQKNIDLELQALKLVQQQLGHSPEAYQPGGGDQEAIDRTKRSRRAADEEEERILQKVLEQSKKEYERQKSLEEEEMEKRIMLAKQESLKSIEVCQKEKQEEVTDSQQKKEATPSPSKEKCEKIKENTIEKEKGEKVKENIVEQNDVPRTSQSPSRAASKKDQKEALPSLTPKHKAQDKVSDAASLWLESAKADIGKDKPGTDSKPVTASNLQDIKAREAYLRRQRDHLIKMKNKAREGSLASSKKKSPTKASPSKTTVATSTENTSKNVQAKGSQSNQGTSFLASGRKMSNTGVLCSAIADKLRIEQK